MKFQPSHFHLKLKRNPSLFTADFRPGNKLIINAALDNLLKGAASQAVQCFNLMHDIDEFHSLKY